MLVVLPKPLACDLPAGAKYPFRYDPGIDEAGAIAGRQTFWQWLQVEPLYAEAMQLIQAAGLPVHFASDSFVIEDGLVKFRKLIAVHAMKVEPVCF